MVLRILPILLLVLILSDLYLYLKFMYQKERSGWGRFLFFLPNTLLLIAAILLTLTESHTPENMSQMVFFFSMFQLIALPKILFLIIDIIGQVLSKIFPRIRKACTIISSSAALLLFAMMVCGLTFGPTFLQVRHRNFSSPDLPNSFNGYRIVQFSDFHLTTFTKRPDMVDKVVQNIMAQQPDMIVFTGDLVSIDAQELEPFKEVLSRLKAPDGVYSIMGNHDYLTYARYMDEEEQTEQCRKLIKTQREMGWDLLLNENRIIRRENDSIAIVGVENDGKAPFPERGDLKKALQGISGYQDMDAHQPRMFKILLSHDPTHWTRKVLPQTDIQLTLSGHTHGMQFMIFGWSPSAFFYPEWKHMYRRDGRGLHVSLGIGGALIPFRFGAWPEINVITLHSK